LESISLLHPRLEYLELHHFPKTRSFDPDQMNDYSYTSETKSITKPFVRDTSFIIHILVFLFLI
jgi:hypothetical protein